jgi:hypothetical protein
VGGELVAWGAENRTDFVALQRRLTAGRGLPGAGRAVSRVLVAFDVLVDGDGQDVRDLRLDDRLGPLDGLVESAASDRLVRCPDTRDVDEARAWAATMADLGIEGVAAKPPASRYRPGRRAGSWVNYRSVGVGVLLKVAAWSFAVSGGSDCKRATGVAVGDGSRAADRVRGRLPGRTVAGAVLTPPDPIAEPLARGAAMSTSPNHSLSSGSANTLT